MARGMNGPMGPRGFLTEEEKKNMPDVNPALLRRIFSYLKPYRKDFLLVFLLILISSALGLLPSVITGRIVDDALLGGDMGLLIRLLLMALLSLLASQLVGVSESYINIGISQRMIYDMKNEMYAHLQSMPNEFFTNEKQGDIITRMNTDINGVNRVVSGTLVSLVSNLCTVAVTLVALFSMSPRLALVGIAVLPLLIIPTRQVGRFRYELASKTQIESDRLNQQINETLSVSGSLLMKLFTGEDYEYSRFELFNRAVTEASIKEQRSGRWLGVAMGMFSNLAPLLIYFAGGCLILLRSEPGLSVGVITATVALVNRLYRPVQSLMDIQVEFTRSLALFTRLFDYLDRENPILAPEKGSRPDMLHADICFENVGFGYGGGKSALHDVSFTVPAGSMCAIVGPSGAGKSTLANLIPRLYDVSSGSIRIGGEDIRDIDLKYLRANVGIVTQDSYLFNGSIMENLLYARPDASREEVELACRIANIHDFIISQPLGYDSQVGNRGLKLSGGEKQRLSIARVLLKNPGILILDEATSALDSISESAIQQALSAVMQGRTSIVIAHRLSTVLMADEILVVDKGRIIDRGSHSRLLSHSGVYRRLYETQFKNVLEAKQLAS